MKGVHSVRRRLATGAVLVYHYAWRGGPRLPGEPGSAEFIAAYSAATREAPPRDKDTLQELFTDYQNSPAFLTKADSTRKGYARRIPEIERAFGDMPIKLVADPRVRGEILDWRDGIAKRSPREADYHMSILALMLAWAFNRRRIACNPAERPGRLYTADRSDAVWTDADVTAFLAVAPPQVRLPFLIALWTGQRQKDVLGLSWGRYDGSTIRLPQSKGHRRVTIPIADDLRLALDAEKRRATVVCLTSRGKPWTADGFKTSFSKACTVAGIDGLTFHDLRGTAVTRLALAGCTVPEIATITGHSLKTVETMLDRHYLGRDVGMAESAIAKLQKHQAGTKIAKRAVKRPSGKVVE